MIASIRSGISLLDPDTEEYWTVEGRPTVEAVAAVTNNQSITREMIDAVAGDLTRESLRQPK